MRLVGGLFAIGCAYIGVQCAIATTRGGDVSWTIGYALFALAFGMLALAGVWLARRPL